jgi:hypothetical protein
MRGAGLAMTCRSEPEWVAAIERFMGDESARREAGQKGLAFASEAYSEASTVVKWDEVFNSLHL